MNPLANNGTALDIIPVGSTEARSPWYRIVEDGHEWMFWAESYDDALWFAFPETVSGYPVMYVGDGFICCRECAVQHWHETGERLTLHYGGDDYGTGEWCECGAEIVPPGCADCGDTWERAPGEYGRIHEPVFQRVNGDAQICARCMAAHVVNGDAWKTGKLTYDVAFNGPWYGGGTYRVGG
jgi:hypothetical protein